MTLNTVATFNGPEDGLEARIEQLQNISDAIKPSAVVDIINLITKAYNNLSEEKTRNNKSLQSASPTTQQHKNLLATNDSLNERGKVLYGIVKKIQSSHPNLISGPIGTQLDETKSKISELCGLNIKPYFA